ncbi:MAG: LuxR C-terminal-related transcriptional regulator [Candidatus Kapaibacterium sp.]
MVDLQKLYIKYSELLASQDMREEYLDYSKFDSHLPILDQISSIKKSGLTVFDMFKKTHIYSSYNLKDIFGYDLSKIASEDTTYIDSMVHPEDYYQLTVNGIKLLEFFFSLDVADRRDYKLQNEYRIKDKNDKYVRVIEQHTILELDDKGNVWLTLSILDISPTQNSRDGLRTQLINIKNGLIIDNWKGVNKSQKEEHLSDRELEILNLIKDGLPSKEISDNLSLSVHTVNTHRQKILKKLGASNSHEAIDFASRLGLI